MTGAETQMLFVRAVLLILLYTFLGTVAFLLWADLRRVGRPSEQGTGQGSALGARLVVIEGGASDRPPGSALGLRAVSGVGRDLDNEVVLRDGTVSARHAVIVMREGAWWVEDLGSTNGTLVNGTAVGPEEPALLRSGDVVQFGAVRLRLVSPEDS